MSLLNLGLSNPRNGDKIPLEVHRRPAICQRTFDLTRRNTQRELEGLHISADLRMSAFDQDGPKANLDWEGQQVRLNINLSRKGDTREGYLWSK